MTSGLKEVELEHYGSLCEMERQLLSIPHHEVLVCPYAGGYTCILFEPRCLALAELALR